MQATHRKTSDNGFRFKPFSRRQKIVLTWWGQNSALRDYDGIICDGSIRSGKSMTMSLSFVMWATEAFNGRNFGICGKTIGSLRRNVINELKTMLAARGYAVEDKISINMLSISRSGHTNSFYLFGGTNEGSQDLIQGVTLAGVLLDEVALMPESFVNQATGRCSIEGAKHWFNCNPGGSRLHWFKANWINRYKEKRYLYLHFTMDDNLSLSEATKERYRRMYTGVFYRRYIEGRWVAAEGVIYDMWNAKENVYDESDLPADAISDCRRYIALDYGTANPMVFLDVLDDGETFWIQNEYYYNARKSTNQTSKTDYEYGNDFDDFVGQDHNLQVIIDPSALSFKAELRNRGYRVREADNEVIDGIRITATLIGRRRIRIKRGMCPNFEREVEAYVWDEKAVQRGEEAPVKENDHCLTGDTLVDTVEGQIPIAELVGKTGYVYSYDTEKCVPITERFFDVRKTGDEAIYRIELEDGRTIKASAEHPILTKRGWVMAQDLTDTDAILNVRNAEKHSKTISIRHRDAVPPFAADNSHVQFVQVKRITRESVQPVYNMEVEHTHCFSINGGLIVHNCMDALRYLCKTLVNRRRLAKG